MPNTELFQRLFKHGQRFILTVSHLVCEFKAVIRLYTLNGIREFLDDMLEKLRGGISTVFPKRL